MPSATFYPAIDSMLQGIPDSAKHTNFGAATIIEHGVSYAGGGKTGWWRTIVNFDVSALADETVAAAKLVRRMYGVVGGGATAKLARCTRPTQWTEPAVDWLHYVHSSGSWTSAGGDYDDFGPPAPVEYIEASAGGDHEITGLKTLVDDANANRGGILSLITLLDNEDPGVNHEYAWFSSEDATHPPRLVVEFAAHLDLRDAPERSGARLAARPRAASRGSLPQSPAHPHRPRKGRGPTR